MKKILIALLTFSLGVSAFNLFHSEKTKVSRAALPEHRPILVLQDQTRVDSGREIGNSKPFFSSFNAKEEFDGWLIADKFKGMREVWTIFLKRGIENLDDKILDDENLDNQTRVWSASVLTMNADGEANDDDDFHSVQIKTGDNHLSFRTNKIRGIEYKFDGEFFKSGKDFSEDEKVLKGTMEKIVRGKTVAKFTADFTYNEPHCFH